MSKFHYEGRKLYSFSFALTTKFVFFCAYVMTSAAHFDQRFSQHAINNLGACPRKH